MQILQGGELLYQYSDEAHLQALRMLSTVLFPYLMTPAHPGVIFGGFVCDENAGGYQPFRFQVLHFSRREDVCFLCLHDFFF